MTEELRKASNKELLEAVLYHYDSNAVVVHNQTKLLKLGFALAQENGWRHVATAWLADFRNKTPLFIE